MSHVRRVTPHHRLQRAFTLVEVLVALFVVALGMGALMVTLTSAADTAAHLRDKSLGEWVALNRISTLRLGTTVPSAGKAEGVVDYAGLRWRWQQTVSDPGIAGLLRIEVSVSHAEGAASATVASATGFYGTSIAPPTGLVPDWSSAGSPPAPGSPTTRVPSPEATR